MRRLQLTDLLSDLEALSEEMHKRRIHVVDAHPEPKQLIGHRVTHGAQPNQWDLRQEKSADDDLDALELFDFGVAGGRHRLAQGTDEVHGAVGDRGWAKQDVLQIADRGEFGPLAAWQRVVPSLRSPVETATWRLLSPGQRR